MNSSLPGLIRIARERKGLSQAELAAKIGVSQAAIGQWERGVFTPRGRNLKALSDVLGLSDTFQEVAEADEELATGGADSRISVAERSKQSFIFNQQFRQLLSQVDADAKWYSKIEVPAAGQWIVDYLTHRSVIELKTPKAYAGVVDLVTQACWRLTVLRAILGEGKNYVVVIQRPPLDPLLEEAQTFYDQKLAGLAYEASLVGLHLIVTDTPEEAVKAIEDLERDLDRLKT